MNTPCHKQTLRLRQGFGRLIRTQRDRGSVVILDHRVTRAWYGSYFLHSLPDMKRVQLPVADTLYALNDFHNPKAVESVNHSIVLAQQSEMESILSIIVTSPNQQR